MKRTIALAAAVVALAGCGGSGSDSSATAQPATPPTKVISAFRAAHLEVGKTPVMEGKDYGLTPRVDIGARRFLIPSLGPDNGGRVFAFSDLDDLHKVKSYYDKLGEAAGVFSSWTYANEDRLVLVQINGDLPRAKALRYGQVVARLSRSGP